MSRAHHSQINLACLFLAMSLAQACAFTGGGALTEKGSLPHLLSAAPSSRVGGEALYEGELRVEGDCVIVASSGQKALPIFDPSVRLTDAGQAIVDGTNDERIAVGERIRASAAYLSQGGKGWSHSEIRSLIGVDVPEGCGDTIIRLRSIRRAVP